MELYPVFDESFQVSPNIWYVISGNGEPPVMRVGHSLVHLRDSQKNKGKLYIIGGANPSGCFNDVHTFDFNKFDWQKLDDTANLPQGCYEHSCFAYNNTSVYVFGGSCENGNLNDTLKYEDNKWTKLQFNGQSKIPTSRTQHIGCVFRNRLIVFGGGESGANAVDDQQVYSFDPTANTWSTLNLKSKQQPSIRHGHLMVPYMDKYIYLHGGMNETNFFNDLWILNVDELTWTKQQASNTCVPCGRAAHGGMCTDKSLYIFGGLSKDHCALDDFWRYDVNTGCWLSVAIHGDNPPSRLDYAFCKITLSVPKRASNESDESALQTATKAITAVDDTTSLINVFDALEVTNNNKFVLNSANVTVESTESESKPSVNEENAASNELEIVNKTDVSEIIFEEKDFLVVHGGMDSLGNVFDDCFVINLED